MYIGKDIINELTALQLRKQNLKRPKHSTLQPDGGLRRTLRGDL